MKCPNCHHSVTRKSKFCTHCGAPVVPRTSQVVTPLRSKWSAAYALGLVAFGIAAGFAIFKFSGDSAENHSHNSIPQSLQSAEVLDIAKEFMCPCGTCSDALDGCTCDDKNGAVEVKSFIAQKLLEGHKKPHIVEMVQERYGGLKSQTSTSFKFKLPEKP